MEVDLMNKYKLSIWGRNFELPLLYECYHDEEVIESQRELIRLQWQRLWNTSRTMLKPMNSLG